MGENKLDPIELQLETVYNREAYIVAIQRLYDKQLKYRLQILDHQATAKVDCKIPNIGINFPTGVPESDLERKTRQLLVNDVKKHMFALDMINKSKHCPVSQLMDNL